MKKIIAPIIIAIIFNLIIPFSNASSKAIVKEAGVRIRSEKSTNSEIVTVVYEDDECELLSDEGEWIKIKYGENIGYAKKEFFTIKADKSNVSNNTASNKIENTTNTVANKTIENTIKNTTVNNTVKNETTNSTISEQTVENVSEKDIKVNDICTLQSEIKLRSIPNLTAQNNITINGLTNVNIKAQYGKWYKVSDGIAAGWITKTKLSLALSGSIVEENKPLNIEEKVKNPEVKDDKKEVETKKDENKDTNTSSSTTTSTKTGVVNVETARVREKASTDSEIIGSLDEDEIISIISEEGDFYKFSTSSISGYVSKKLITLKDVVSRGTTESRENLDSQNLVPEQINNTVNQALVEENKIETTSSANGSAVVEKAKQYLGYSYVSGGKNPDSGFDCSGFTKYIFSNFGVELGATAASQSTVGTEIARENLQTGDLLIFYDEGMTKIGHVGIYMENGEFIHSANPKRGVVTDNLNTNSYYNKRFITARRLVN